jgi:rubredoxin
MQSINKRAPNAAERRHIHNIKGMPCAVCGQHPTDEQPTEAHEIEQGQWFTSIPLCPSCHRDNFNGIHGQRRIWNVLKKTELSVLNDTIRELVT